MRGELLVHEVAAHYAQLLAIMSNPVDNLSLAVACISIAITEPGCWSSVLWAWLVNALTATRATSTLSASPVH
jgi:hypothetical protein